MPRKIQLLAIVIWNFKFLPIRSFVGVTKPNVKAEWSNHPQAVFSDICFFRLADVYLRLVRDGRSRALVVNSS